MSELTERFFGWAWKAGQWLSYQVWTARVHGAGVLRYGFRGYLEHRRQMRQLYDGIAQGKPWPKPEKEHG